MKKIFLLIVGVLVFGVGEAQLKVDQEGEVLIGDLGNAERSLHVRGGGIARIDRAGPSAPSFFLVSYNDNFAAVKKNFIFGNKGDGINNGYFFIGDYGTALSGVAPRRFVIDNDGDVIIGSSTSISDGHKLRVEGSAFKTDGGSNWNVLSDLKTKSNITEFKGGLKEILKMKPVEFDYNGQGGTKKGAHSIGVVAQELQKIAPYMVEEFTYSYDDGLIDVDNEIETKSMNSEQYLSVNPSSVKWMLVNAVKEQQNLIERQESDIETLKDEINEMKLIVQELTTSYQKLVEGISITEIDLSYHDFSSLGQNIPNPFSSSTSIEYVVANNSRKAEIQIFDLSGYKIKVIPIEHVGKGELQINAIDIPTGVYSFSLIVDGKLVDTKKMNLTR